MGEGKSAVGCRVFFCTGFTGELGYAHNINTIFFFDPVDKFGDWGLEKVGQIFF